MPDDILVCKAMMGLGNIPMELANLHAFIIGMKLSLTRGIQHLRVIGNFDAINVCLFMCYCIYKHMIQTKNVY
ncbi:hypothetical protein QJS04_geneDACA000440 [Acorus gramineus]|uniref:RNase H type-1 domain-containing protein n=1 Tax=Acorus gramineus TaxID=55184 RepID=A0AAV9APT4_ACOGR|nr:hypothetical protein QJS04_geneDACA000440 [Acorus gramineus]